MSSISPESQVAFLTSLQRLLSEGIENVGMVTLTFHASWSAGMQPPSNEPTITVAVPNPDAVAATGFGTEESTDIRGVNRTIGVPRAVVAFRYKR